MTEKNGNDSVEESSAAITEISLSQAILAPLDAVFKAQIHSARSFLNLVLQLGYPHKSQHDEKKDNDNENSDDKPYTLEFINDLVVDGEKRRQKISIPALAAVPITPLAVESAEFDFTMQVAATRKHGQTQKSRIDDDADYDRHKRPWFLVDQPISVRGTFAPEKSSQNQSTSTIHVSVKVGQAKVPSGLNKFITSLSEFGSIEEIPLKTSSEDKT